MKTEKYVVTFCKRLMACGNCLDTNNHKAFSRFRIYLHEKCGLGGDWVNPNSEVTIAMLSKQSLIDGGDVPILSTFVDQIGWACGITRKFDSDISIDNKARDVKNLLNKAVRQVPDNVPSVIHIALETLEGRDVELRRTEKIMESIPGFITDKPVLGVRVHRFQSNMTMNKLWEFDETTERFQVDWANLEGVPDAVVIPQDTPIRDGNHWD